MHRLVFSLIAMLAAMMVLWIAPAHADRDSATCMPDAAHACCDEMDHAGSAHDAASAGHAGQADPCDDMDCAAMTACASGVMALLPGYAGVQRLDPDRHAGPADAAAAPLQPPSIPEQPPRA